MLKKLSLALVLGLATAAQAQTFPQDRPLKMVVPYPAGGITDVLARLLAAQMTTRLGKPMLVENVPGASGNIGAMQVVRAAPDGHTLVMGATPLSTNPAFSKDLPFDVLKDMTPITQLTRQSFVLVLHPSVPANTVPELVALAKAQPGKLTFASHSAGGATHLAGELFKLMAGIDLLHVPYKGNAPATADTVAGRVSMLFDSWATSQGHVKAGKLKALATTGPVRAQLVADGSLPTMAEHKGFEGFSVVAWFGILGPANLPPAIADKLSAEFAASVKSADVASKLNAAGLDVVTSTPKEFGVHVQTEVAKWTRVVKESGAKLEP